MLSGHNALNNPEGSEPRACAQATHKQQKRKNNKQKNRNQVVYIYYLLNLVDYSTFYNWGGFNQE